MKKQIHSIIVLLLILTVLFAGSVQTVLAQTPEAPVYTMGLNRDFGYGAGSQIRGLFTARVAGPEGIQQVEYLIDGETMIVVSEAPFTYQFNTSSYSFGTHDLTARVTTTDGKVYVTPARHFNFVTREQEGEGMQKILFPLLGGIAALMLVSVLVQTLLFRSGKRQPVAPGTERKYGYAGGSICPKCHRPTPRHMMGFNLGIGKLDYCENCGKWSIMRAVPLEILRTAEIAEKADARKEAELPHYEKSEEEKLKDLLEESKYEKRD